MHRFLLIVLLITSPVVAQDYVAIGEWRDHFPYEKGLKITYGDGIVYCATEYAMYSYDPVKQETQRISKTSGLSDVGITALAYNQVYSTVVVGYGNGNIDLLRDGGTVNSPFIKLNSSIIGNKRINDVYMQNNLAYISCGFGIVVMDLSKDEIKETYIIGTNNTALEVFDLTIHNDSIWAATEDGLYKAYVNEPFLLDFNNWHKDMSLPLAIRNGPLNRIMEHTGDIFVTHSGGIDELYVSHANTWQPFSATVGQNINSIGKKGADLMVSLDDTLMVYSLGGIQQDFYDFFLLRPQDAYAVGQDVFIASEVHGLLYYKSTDKYVIKPSGPKGVGAFNMDAADGTVWVVGGGITGSSWVNLFNPAAVSSYIDNTWKKFELATVQAFRDDTTYDFLSVVIDPDDPGHVFAGTMSYLGLAEFQDNEYKAKYDESNSALQSIYDKPGVIAITDMAYDDDGNLWICNMKTDRQLVVKRATNSWRSFDLGNDQNDIISHIAVDDNGYKWILSPSVGVWVYDDNGTITDDSDDRKKLLTGATGSGGLPSLSVKSIVVDLDGEVWVGTDAGPVVFYSPESVFDANFPDAQQILIEQDGNLQLLLETETVTALAVDGANRKWIGTRTSGVFLMSEDGTEEIYHFTTNNSPLLSNEIISLAVDGKTGEVFFGTEKGIISFRSTATAGDPFFTDVYAFPNPVREDYYGPIAIKGLARNSDVKITDVSGRVVYFTTSYGGQAIWDGNNFSGERAQTGVYLVFATDANGDYSEVTKILLIN